MKIRTLNKRRKKLNKYKAFLMKYIHDANKLIKSNDPLLIITPGFRMYFNYLQYLYRSKKYKQFYYEVIKYENEK